MKPINITGVTNYNLSVSQKSVNVLLLVICHSCRLYQKHFFIKAVKTRVYFQFNDFHFLQSNLNSLNLFKCCLWLKSFLGLELECVPSCYSSQGERLLTKTFLQFNGFFSAKSGTHSHPQTAALTPRDSPAVCSRLYEWTGFFSYSFLLRFLTIHCKVGEYLMHLQMKSSLMLFAVGALMLNAVLNKSWMTTSWHMAFYFSFRAGLVTKHLSIQIPKIVCLLSTCILNTF